MHRTDERFALASIVASALFWSCAAAPNTSGYRCISGDCTSGVGIAVAAPGRRYEGSFQGGRFHGAGKLTTEDGTVYDGEFASGLQNGQGTLVTSDGTKYVGAFRNGHGNGSGTLTAPAGSSFTGPFVNSRPTGLGTFRKPDGETQSATWINGQMQFTAEAKPPEQGRRGPQGRSSLVQEGSIGTPDVASSPVRAADPTRAREITDWIGERFIFLPMPKDSTRYGYQLIRRQGNMPFSGTEYDEAVGRVAVVVGISKDLMPTITLQMEDTAEIYETQILSGSVMGIAPIADIHYARDRWKGKPLWLQGKSVGTYNAVTGDVKSMEVRRLSAVLVRDVVAGWYNTSPVRFIVETAEGKTGFVDVNLSGTNVSAALRDYHRFTDTFYEEDPRVKFGWPNRTWEAIAESQVFVGMTAQQARLSWGRPQSINRTTGVRGSSEQWVYQGGDYLYFENGVLSTIQN